ncbi:MAG: InlB B-repeat-containing protein, partial [Candidatus Binatia bacterium]
MQSILYQSVVLLLCVLATSAASAYQGFGTETPGGPQGTVVHVTNLGNAGPGSLRDALSQGNRYIVFDVGGEITLSDEIDVKGAFITLDGFTAPVPVTLVHYGLRIDGDDNAHDIIIQGIRVRNAKGDGISIRNGAHSVVISHVSIQGSTDGAFDVTQGAFDVTIQWSILAQNAGIHNLLSLVEYKALRVTFHHNLLLSGQTRNPQSGWDESLTTTPPDTVTDIRNNVIWDFSAYGTVVTKNSKANVVNNFYHSLLQPSASRALNVTKGGQVYASGNFSSSGADINSQGNQQSPFPAEPVDTTDACSAAHRVLAEAGVQPFDIIDQQYLSTITLPPCGQSPTFTLTATKQGTSSGTVTGTGIDCGADCSKTYPSGTMVTLTATADAGSTFAGWSGDCDSNGQVTMDANRSCTATFNLQSQPPQILTLATAKVGSGSGAVTSSPTGIDCGADCSESYTSSTAVTLTPTPEVGSIFVGWSGDPDCSDGQVTMDVTKTCIATFNLQSPQQFALTVTKVGTGDGTVISSPAGINCGADCSASYNSDTVVALTATPVSGSTFAGWAGDADCTDGSVTLTADKICTATFTVQPPAGFIT